jgi:transcriptional regulator
MMLWNDDNPENPFVETHISMTNIQAKEISNGDELLCDFLGTHTYISSSWYNHINASTWNYEAVQILGIAELMNNEELYNHLNKLTNKFESQQKCPMTMEKMGEKFVNSAMKGAFGVKIYPTEISIAQKFSQNRNDEDFANIIAQLEKSTSLVDKEMAEKMKLSR